MANTKYCELCDKYRTIGEECPSPKNGYCAVFQLQAEADVKEIHAMKTGGLNCRVKSQEATNA